MTDPESGDDPWFGGDERRAAMTAEPVAIEAWLRLKHPFPKEQVETYERDGKTFSKIDARHIQDRLDWAVGPQRWRTSVTAHERGVIVRLEIRPDREGPWFTREEGADYGDMADHTGEPTRSPYGLQAACTAAFKRACAQFGIGRQAYLDTVDIVKPRESYQAPPPARRATRRTRATGGVVSQGFTLSADGTPWDDMKCRGSNGAIKPREFDPSARWASWRHGTGNKKLGFDQHGVGGFIESEHGRAIRDITWGELATKAKPGDDACGYLIWEIENTTPSEPRWERSHGYKIAQNKGVLLHVYRSHSIIPQAGDELPLELEDQIAEGYTEDFDASPF
jgi:hypothetical protein